MSAASTNRHILVVDDEQLVCDAVKMLLVFDGHTVETVNNAENALALLQKTRFDVVFTDFDMPGMKGNQLASVIKARNPGQPVILITAYAETLQPAQLACIDCVVGKPFQLDVLRQAIAKALGRSGP